MVGLWKAPRFHLGQMSAENLEKIFPNLGSTPYKITSDEAVIYNCIAWAAGKSNQYWWPRRGYFWPKNEKVESVDSFVEVFRSFGYECCQSSELEPEFEKVAIYARGQFPTHMARQICRGEWTSKCGDLEDISHILEALEGDEYGDVVILMKRRRVMSVDYLNHSYE